MMIKIITNSKNKKETDEMIKGTPNGHAFFEATSAFQKAIRRGDEKVALYIMVEFFNMGYDEYLWRRMKIICSEDIGLAEPTMPAILQGLYQMYSDQKKHSFSGTGDAGRPERLFITQAVLMMARAKKSRLVDHVLMVSWIDHKKMDLPDYAFDKHTAKGKAMGRGLDHFFKEGMHLENHAEQPGEKEAKKQRYQLVSKPGFTHIRFDVGKKGATQNTMFDEDGYE